MLLTTQAVYFDPTILNVIGALIALLLGIIAFFLKSFHLEVKELKVEISQMQLREASETASSKAVDKSFVDAMRRYEAQCANICRTTDKRISRLTDIVEKHEVEIHVLKTRVKE